MITSAPAKFIKGRLKKICSLCLCLLLLNGCSIVHIGVALGPEAQKLREGERYFAVGEYDKADALFVEVLDSDPGEISANTALYNLVCTRIITAKTDADFLAAIDLLKDWKTIYPSGIYVENPNLMITALQNRASLLSNVESTSSQKEKEQEVIIASQKDEISTLKQALDKLQHQITELQAIDQQLQEKKKPL